MPGNASRLCYCLPDISGLTAATAAFASGNSRSWIHASSPLLPPPSLCFWAHRARMKAADERDWLAYTEIAILSTWWLSPLSRGCSLVRGQMEYMLFKEVYPPTFFSELPHHHVQTMFLPSTGQSRSPWLQCDYIRSFLSQKGSGLFS